MVFAPNDADLSRSIQYCVIKLPTAHLFPIADEEGSTLAEFPLTDRRQDGVTLSDFFVARARCFDKQRLKEAWVASVRVIERN